MFTANYHTHTVRCNHAEGTEREYVEAAISAGIKILGFSDHTPYVGFPDGYYSGFRMRPEQLEDYVRTICDMRSEYKNDIEIHLGLEAEYYPKLFDGLLRFLEPYGIEYLILGQHCVNNETDGIYSGAINTEADLVQYASQCCEGMETGCFSYLCHPDMVCYDRRAPEFRREMKRICDTALRLDIPLEINLLGLRSGRNYPCREFFEAAAETGNRVIFGADAHEPKAFAHKKSVAEAEKYVSDLGLAYTDNLTLKGIFAK